MKDLNAHYEPHCCDLYTHLRAQFAMNPRCSNFWVVAIGPCCLYRSDIRETCRWTAACPRAAVTSYPGKSAVDADAQVCVEFLVVGCWSGGLGFVVRCSDGQRSKHLELALFQQAHSLACLRLLQPHQACKARG